MRRSRIVIAAITLALLAADISVAATRGGSSDKRPSVTARLLAVQIKPSAYDVAPPFGIINYGPTPRYPACQLSAVRATAHLERTGDVISGVAMVEGDRCSLVVSTTPTLLGRYSKPLAIPVVKAADSDSAAGYDLPFGSYGRVTLGFTWRGSWCGSPAIAVLLTVNGGELRIPLSGSQPSCIGTSSAELVTGVLGGYPSNAVQGPPPEWAHLIVSVTAARFIQDTHLGVLRVVLLNRTSHPIALTPIPTYLVGLWDLNGEGTAGIAERPLPPRLAGKIVPAHGWAWFDLPRIRFDDREMYPPNGLLRVEFSFAGVPMAVTYTTLRCRHTTVQLGGRRKCLSPFVPSGNR